MSDRYFLHCETHDVDGVGMQNGVEELSFIWGNRTVYTTLYDALSAVDVPYQAELEWAHVFISDHEFDRSLDVVIKWIKQHDDCAVYVYSYAGRVGNCFEYVTCPHCGTRQRCKRKSNHDGDHSTVQD